MTKVESKTLPLGLYRVFWKSGGISLAAVGQDYDGNRWIAPTNWVTPGVTDYWRNIERVERIEVEK